MENRPHSRGQSFGSGSAHVGGGHATGGGRVGSGGRPGASGGGFGTGSSGGSGGTGGRRYSGGGRGVFTGGGGRLSGKTIIIIALIAVVAFVFIKKSGGNFSDLTGGSEDTGGYTDSSYSDYTGSASSGSADLTVSPLARDKFYSPSQGDTVTVMVYMCGTDLESKYGMATKDLNEMLKANISDNVNLIIETGGCKNWQNSTISSACNQIYKIESGKLLKVEDNAGRSAMTDPDNLTDFIKYCDKKFPADRNILILWDHGGGSVTGYGYDEKNSGSSSMTLAKISSALDKAGVYFDFIGFDACLMATLENALVCSEYADYLIASEETEPGTGWYYTNWLSALSADTSVSTVTLGKKIIDDFVSSCGNADVTLSIVDLAELEGTLPEAFRDFSVSTTEMIRSDDYAEVSTARAGARQFSAENKLNQIDLADFADRLDTDESRELASVLKSAVKYNKTTMSRCYGISIYFPYETTKTMNSAVSSYKQLGMDSEYTKCIQSFASLEAGGQIAASSTQGSFSGSGDLLGSLLGNLASGGASTNPLDVLLGGFTSGGSSAAGLPIDAGDLISLLSGFSGRAMPEGLEWVDTELVAQKAQTIAKDFIDPARITASTVNGQSVLSLTENEWALISTCELSVYAQDGSDFLDLGLDNVFSFDDDGNLILGYDGTWLCVNGNACAYYMVSDTQDDNGNWVTTGRIPALLNDEFVNLAVVFDDEHKSGAITGAYPLYEDGQTELQAKGNIEINEGDEITLIADCYDENNQFIDSYTLGDSFTVPASGLYLENLSINADGLAAMYRLTDIYGNHFWINAE